MVIVSGSSFGNLLLSIGMNHQPDFIKTDFGPYLASLMLDVHIIFGTLLLAIGLITQLFFYTWADLTYVLPVTASGYVVTALLSHFLLQENISLDRWLGVAVITAGVMMVSGTPVRTHDLEPKQ